ncbi:MAG: amidohydrolase family protein, partial [Acidobacteriota bacterium]
AATLDAALLLALPDLGELAVGHGADIVVTTANPLADIRHARAIDAVVFRGEALTRAHLNRMGRAAQP